MLRFAANISTLFPENPFLERFAAARDAGFMAVEIQFPYEYPVDALVDAATRAGMPIVLINAPGGTSQTAGSACRPELRAVFRASLEQARAYAAVLEVPRINVLAGRAESHELSACRACLSENLSLAATAFEAVGAQALLEPLNSRDCPGYCVADFQVATQVLEATDPRVGLQFDIYGFHLYALARTPSYLEQLARSGEIRVRCTTFNPLLFGLAPF